MDDFPANSKKVKAAQPTEAPRETLKPVTTAKTQGRKRGLGRQFKDTFIIGTPREAFGYAIEDVMIPAIRDMFLDAMHGGLDRLFNGERVSRSRSASPWMHSPVGHVDYNAQSRPRTQQSEPRALSRKARARHSFDEIIIDTRPEAEEVIDRMFDILSRDGVVSVAFLYALVDVQSSHIDLKWGWTNLRGARAVRTRRGDWLLNLPEPEPLT